MTHTPIPGHATRPGPFADPVVLAAMVTLGVILIARLVLLVLDPNSLYADETQYWIWSQTLDWGYFSKPPMIAWIIALTTSIFGDSDWAVRLAAPILHTATAAFLGLTAARLYGPRAGGWTAIGWITMPGVWISASVITTDAVLLMFWSGGLYALIRLRQHASWPSAIALGIAIGLGFLSKYAMVYFVIGTVASMLIDRPTREALLGLKGLGVALIGLGFLIPNLAWNAAHEFATVSHTAANANWGASLFNPGELFSFLTDQLGVIGPAFFVVLLIVLTGLLRRGLQPGSARPEVLLLLFVIPVLAIVSAQAFISRAHANWAAAAYAAGIILVISWLLQGGQIRRYILWGSVAFHVFVGVVMVSIAASQPLSEALGLANAVKRLRGWPETAAALTAFEDEIQPSAVVFDNRNDFHQMQRYAPGIEVPLYMWLRHAGPTSHAEQGWPLPDGYDAPVLVVSERPEEQAVLAGDFQTFERVGEITIPIGAGRVRHYDLFSAQGYQRVERTPEYEARLREDSVAATPAGSAGD